MLVVKQRGIDYFYKSKPCKNHKRIAKSEDVWVEKICKKCGAELLAIRASSVIGKFSPFLNGVIVSGYLKIECKSKDSSNLKIKIK